MSNRQGSPAHHPGSWRLQSSSTTVVALAAGAVFFSLATAGLVEAGTLQTTGSYPTVQDWIQRNAPGPVKAQGHVMAYDPTLQATFRFGGDTGTQDVWFWTGLQWLSTSPSVAPSARTSSAVAADTAKAVVVLYGGSTGAGETWEWDGFNWEQRTPATSPPPLAGHAMAYEAARRRTLLFGGLSSGTPSAQTWTWDHFDWVKASPAASPSARAYASLAYDTRRDRAVLFGGAAAGVTTGDTWEWDGENWTQVAPLHGPSARQGHSAAYDPARGQVVLFGGFDGASARNAETWLYDGTDWTQATPATAPSARSGAAMSYDLLRDRVVLSGGSATGLAAGDLADTWEWDGTNWAQVAPLSSPSARLEGSCSETMGGDLLIFSGSNQWGNGSVQYAETWAWNGTNWSQKNVTSHPPGRKFAISMAYDTQRGRNLVLDGTGAAKYDEMLEWNGTSWTSVVPATRPAFRTRTAMAFHEKLGKTLVHGGFGALNQAYTDTWTWDGASWVKLTLATSPGSRWETRMAYDRAREVLVLFAGRYKSPTGDASNNETWEFDGTSWLRRTPATSPVARSEHAVAYDPDRKATLIYGGTSAGFSDLKDTWAWDGSNWSQLATSVLPTASRMSPYFGYHRATHTAVLFGGSKGFTASDQTWLLPSRPASLTVSFTPDVLDGTPVALTPHYSQPDGITATYRYVQTFGPPATITPSPDGATASVEPSQPGTIGLMVVASTGGSYAYAFGGIRSLESFVPASPATLTVDTLTFPARASRGQTFAATVVVANSGASSASVTSASLDFGAPGLAVTTAPGNPVSIPGGGSASFRFSVTAAEDATTGAFSPAFTLQAGDVYFGSDVGLTATTDAAVTIQTPAALSAGTVALPATASKGQSFVATVPVANTGEATAVIGTASLTCDGAGVTASAAPGNPTSLPGGASATFAFDVTVSAGAASGSRGTSLAFSATDENSGLAAAVTLAPAPAVTIQSPPALDFSLLDAPSFVTQGQSFAATVLVTNSGEATADLTSALLTFDGTELTATASQGNASTLAGGASTTLSFAVETGSSAATGPRSASLAVGAVDANSLVDVSLTQALAPPVTVQSPPSLAFGPLSASGPARQGRGFTARVDVTNAGGATADISAASLGFTGAGLTASASASNPTSLPGGATATFAYEIAVSASAATGPRTATLSVEAADRNSGEPAGQSESLTPSLDVFASPALSLAGFETPASVSQGQTFAVTVTVENSGNGAADVTSAALTFSTEGLTATTLPGQPSTLPAHATAAFRFSVSASAHTTPGPITATAHVGALDPSFSDDASVAGALTPAFLLQTPPHLTFGLLQLPATASQGQTLTATVTVANSGQATALLTSAELVFDGIGVTATPAATNPVQVPGETTATFVYAVALAPDAPAGPRAATLTAVASDANSGADASLASTAPPSLIVQTPAALSVGPLQAPVRASQGRAFLATVTVANTGGAAAGVTTATLTFSGSGLTVSPEPGNPASIAGGATATFSFSVDVAGAAAPGARTAFFSITAADSNSGADKSVSQPLSPGVEVLSSASVVFSRLDTRATATLGQVFAASVVVTSNGGQTADITATALTFSGTGLTAVADPSNPNSLPSGQTATFRYTVTAAAVAAPGSRTATLRVFASDGNTGQDVTRQANLAPAVILQTPAALVAGTLVVPDLVSQGQAFEASVSVANTGGSTADVSSHALVFAGSGLTATAAGTQPAVLAGGATATFSYTVSVTSEAAAGPRTATITLQATERNTGAARNLSASLAPAVTVQTPPALELGDLHAPALVSQGQTFTATVQALNSGGATLELTSAALGFDGAGLTAVPLPGNPASLAGGSVGLFAFSVTAGAAAAGPRLATLTLHGRDANSGASAGSTAELTPPVTVQTPPDLAFGPLEAAPALSQGQTYLATVPVSNRGEAVFEVTSTTLAFDASGITATPRAGNPDAIPGSESAELHFDITVVAEAPLGTRTAMLTVGGRDRNSGADASRSGPLAPALRVEGRPSLSLQSVVTGASSVSRGQTVTGVAVTVRNDGNARASDVEAGLVLGSSAPGFATTRAGGPLPELAAGATATFLFSVTVGSEAPLGPLTLDATATATDPVFGGVLSEAGAGVTATWLIQSPPALTVRRFEAPASLARRHSATAAVEVANEGQATALISSAQFLPGHTGVTVTAAPGNPAILPGGVTNSFAFELACATDAPLGPITPTFRLLATDRNSSTAADLTTALDPVEVVKPPNSAPLAALSTDVVRVFYGNPPVLTASASDLDFGDLLTYHWTVTSRPFGSAADESAFAPNDSDEAAVTSFSPDRSGLYTVSLVAVDGTTASVPVTASVQVLRYPVASVAGSPVATLHVPTRLDGSASRDLDGGLLTYQWTFASQPSTSLLTAGHLSPNFSSGATYTRLCADVKGTYTVRLSVSNGVATSSADFSVNIGNSAPSAVILGSPEGRVGEPVTLRAAADDEDGDALTYRWTVDEFPAGGAGVTLSPNGMPSASTTQFTPAAPGFHRISLVVSDGQAETLPQSVSLLVGAAATAGAALAPPVPKIRRLTNRVGGPRLLRLSGRPSRTAQAGPVTAYSWSLQSAPPGALPFAATGITMSYSGVVPGSYTLRLTVADSQFQTASATTTLTVLPLPPRPKAKVPPYILLKRGRVRPPQFKGDLRFAQAPDPGTAEDVKLDGTASEDPGGAPITYQWVIVQAPDTPSYANPVDIVQDGTAKGESVAAAPDPTGADGSVLTTLTAFNSTSDPRPQLFFSTATPPELAKTGREPQAAGLVDDGPYAAEGEYTYGLQVTSTDPDGKKKTALLEEFLAERVSTYATAGSGGITCSAGKNRKILVNFGPSGELTPTFDPVTQKKAGYIRLDGQVMKGRKDYEVEEIFWGFEGRPEGSKADRLLTDPNLDIDRFNSGLKAAEVRRLKAIFFPDLPGEYRFSLRVLQSEIRTVNSRGFKKKRFFWSPISRVTINLIDVRTVLRPVAHLIAQDGIRPKVDIYAGSGRKYIPYGATIILSGETPGVNANLLLTEWQQLEGPPWSLETETRRQAFFAPQPPSKVREPGNYRFRFKTRIDAGDAPFTDDVAFTILPPPMSQRPPPVCFDGLAKAVGPLYDQIDPAAVGLRLTATASTTSAAGEDFDPEDTGAPAPSSLTVTLPTTVVLGAEILGADQLGYAAYDFYWLPVTGPSTELSRYQDLANTARGSRTQFTPTTGGVYEFEAQATPYDENDRLMEVTFKRRLRVNVESEDFRCPSAQASASATSVPATGPETALTVTLSALVSGLDGPSQDGTTPRTGGDFLPAGSFFSWVQLAGPAADLANPGATVTRVTFPEAPNALEAQQYAFEFSIRTVQGGYSEPVRVTVVQRKPAGPELVSNLARVFISGVAAGEVMPLTTSLLSGNLTIPENLEDGELLTVEAVDEAGERLSPPVILRTLLIRLSPTGSNQAISEGDGVLTLASSAVGGQILSVFSGVPLPTPQAVQSPPPVWGPAAGASAGVGGAGGGGCSAFPAARAGAAGLDGLAPLVVLTALLLLRRRRRLAAEARGVLRLTVPRPGAAGR